MRRLLLCTAFLLSTTATAQEATWVSTEGPGISTPTEVALDEGENVYIWSRYGLRVSEDGGATWSPYPQPYLAPAGPYPVRFAFQPGGDYFLGFTLVVGSTGCQPGEDEVAGTVIHVDVQGNSAVETAAGGGRDYRFLDLTDAPDGRAWAIFGDYCGGGFEDSYLTSYDPDADAWTPLAGTGPEGEVFDLAWVGSDTALLLAGLADGIYASTDGTTLTRLGLDGEAVYAVAQTPTGTLLAGTASGLHRSTDDGVTWLPVATVTAAIHDLHVGPDLLLAATDAGVLYSTDDGETWGQSPLGAASYHIAGTTDGSYAVTADGATVYLSDDGETWAPALYYDGLVTDLAFAPEGLLAADPGRAYYRFANAAWERLPFPSSLRAPAIATAPDGTYYAVGYDFRYSDIPYTYSGILYRSDDAGASWTSVRGFTGENVDVEITSVGTILLYLSIPYENEWLVLRSEDGTTWSTTLSNIGPAHLQQGVSGAVYAITEYGYFVSTDDGQTWEHHSGPPYPADGLGTLLEAPEETLLVGTCDGVFRSEDGGATWIESDLGHPVRALAQNSAGDLFAGVRSCYSNDPQVGGVYRSTDGGQTWQPYGLDEQPVYSFAVDADGVLFAGTDGGVFQTLETTVATEETATPRVFAVEPAYPNPFTGSTTVAVTLPEPGSVTAIVYDAVGRAVATLHDGLLAAGRHALTWTGEHHAGGVYFVRITGPSGTRTVPVTLAR